MPNKTRQGQWHGCRIMGRYQPKENPMKLVLAVFATMTSLNALALRPSDLAQNRINELHSNMRAVSECEVKPSLFDFRSREDKMRAEAKCAYPAAVKVFKMSYDLFHERRALYLTFPKYGYTYGSMILEVTIINSAQEDLLNLQGAAKSQDYLKVFQILDRRYDLKTDSIPTIAIQNQGLMEKLEDLEKAKNETK